MAQKTYRFLLIGVLLLLMLTVSGGLTLAQNPPLPPNPADFVAVIDNPYLPLIPGTTFIYEGMTEDGLENVEIKILSETRQVMGLTATVVQDTVYVDGELVEQTFDWFAQDKTGNVWYLGEAVDNYEDGQLLDHAGSWEAGVAGALPGIVMFADPAAHLGETYYQEYYAGEAEDQAKLLSASESVSIAYGSYNNVVKTYDFTALDPDSQEEKFYAAGIGPIKTVDLKTGETFALIEFTPGVTPPPAATSTPATISTPAARSTIESTCGTDSGLGCAPDSARVDLVKPSFSNPTNVTNPLFPISQLHSAVLLGNIDGHLFRAETTLLPDTKAVDLNGQQVKVLISQYTAYLDGRIDEIALDRYAQADDGSVWYLGEDVFNYKDGVIADTNGTWLAGQDGPAAMIMPANPQVGEVYRPENSPGIVFEEVTVKGIGETVDGPHGPIAGAIVTEELHMDGSKEDKIFAPGYGEFSTGSGGDLEALAIATPTDALSEAPPAELETLLNGAADIFNAAESEDWDAASATLKTMTAAWATYQASGTIPELLDAQMSRALDALAGDALVPAVNHRNVAGTRKAAIDVAQASLDLQLRYRPPAEIDLARFNLWTQQVLVDAAGDEPGPVLGDVTVLEWVWERFGHTLDSTAVSTIEAQLGDLRAAADDEDLEAASEAAGQLRDTLAALKLTSETDSPGPSIVNINPADFVDVVDNPYYPRIPGTKYVYEGKTKEGLERSEREVLAETREVMGITATVVRDRVYMDGALIEDTYEWFAQGKDGSVWFLGEAAENYENGVLVDTAGSWEAGVDGALPGIVMLANPATHIGETYHQQYYKGVAEDMADMLSVSQRVTVPYSSFDNAVQTKDYTPLEPDIVEHKFYAKGIGVVKTVNLNTGEELVLIEFMSS